MRALEQLLRSSGEQSWQMISVAAQQKMNEAACAFRILGHRSNSTARPLRNKAGTPPSVPRLPDKSGGLGISEAGCDFRRMNCPRGVTNAADDPAPAEIERTAVDRRPGARPRPCS